MPHELEKRTQKQLHKKLASSHPHIGIQALRFLGRCVLAAIVITILLGATFAISPTVRSNTLNVLMALDAKLATWSVTNSDTTTAFEPHMLVSVNWIPDGYRISPLQPMGENDWLLECKNDKGNTIRVALNQGLGTNHAVDVEDAANVRYININEVSAVLSEKDGFKRVAWMLENSTILVSIISDALSEDELIKVCQNVTVYATNS